MKAKLTIFTIIVYLISNLKGDCSTGTDELCGKCDSTKACQICYNSYKSGKTCKSPAEAISQCELYADDKNCMKCKDGYFVEDFSDMTSCSRNNIFNCFIINPYNVKQCLFCDGYQLNANGLCDNVSCTAENCRSCELDGTSQVCTLCNSGYVLSATATCLKEENTLLGCAKVDSDNKCTVCRYGYYVDSELAASQLACKKSQLYEFHSLWKVDFAFLLVNFFVFLI